MHTKRLICLLLYGKYHSINSNQTVIDSRVFIHDNFMQDIYVYIQYSLKYIVHTTTYPYLNITSCSLHDKYGLTH